MTGRRYRLTRSKRLINTLMAARIRLGIMTGSDYLLTVPGRKTGRPYTTPVTLIEDHGQRWLVAPYGNVSWVRNARAAGEVTIRQGRSTERLPIHEVNPEESGPVLKRYVQKVRVVRPYFRAGPDDPVHAFEAEASQHPVFSLDAR